MEQICYRSLPNYYIDRNRKYLSTNVPRQFKYYDLVPIRYLINNLHSVSPIPVKYPDIDLEKDKLVLYYNDFVIIFKDNKDLLLFRLKYGI